MTEPLTSSPPEPLQEEFFLTDAARLRRWLPWMHLGAALRMAFDPRKLLLAMIALCMLSLPDLIRERFGSSPDLATAVRLPWQRGYLFRDQQHPVPPAEEILADPWSTVRYAVGQGPQTLTPIAEVMSRGRSLIESKFHWLRTGLRAMELLWVWFVWAVFGTLMCRLTVLDFMGRDVGWGEAWRYCRRRVVSAFASPLLPMVGVFAFWFPCVVAGWVTRIPAFGAPLVAIGWVLWWIFGAALALILLGLTLCWPMMIATIGVEGTDAFDGLSRSYNYLFSRPWYVVWMTCVMLFIGGCTLFGVRWLEVQANHLAVTSMSSGASRTTIEPFLPEATNLSATTPNLLRFGRGVITLGVNAFAHSYFWVAVTVMFLLLRKSVDSTPLDHLTADRQTPLGELPIVGMAAAVRREQASATRSEP